MSTTIVAIATASGKAGVGIVRVSGPQALSIAEAITQRKDLEQPLHLVSFYTQAGELIDQGLLLRFVAPHSFTGEHVVEFQAHGSPLVLDQLVTEALAWGATLAGPGEFTQRAFLNNKMDLAQAEAVSDLIHAHSQQAARSAAQSLTGAFSNHINALQAALIALRVEVEATVDFAEEEIDSVVPEAHREQIASLIDQLAEIQANAQQGVLLQDGLRVVIAGEPNVGKSSLFNYLTQEDSAIVTDIPGTTRDVLTAEIQIAGLPVFLKDTAGMRETDDVIEQTGIQKTNQAMAQADLVLWLSDYPLSAPPALTVPYMVIQTKADQLREAKRQTLDPAADVLISTQTGFGINALKTALQRKVGYAPEQGAISARQRHLDALARCEKALRQGLCHLREQEATEILAEELRAAQKALSDITGEMTNDDLLGHIFSTFCIGK